MLSHAKIALVSGTLAIVLLLTIILGTSSLSSSDTNVANFDDEVQIARVICGIYKGALICLPA